jgi:hypothetical protein
VLGHIEKDIQAAETELDEYALLFSTKEWKKIRVQYFVEPDMTLEQMVTP